MDCRASLAMTGTRFLTKPRNDGDAIPCGASEWPIKNLQRFLVRRSLEQLIEISDRIAEALVQAHPGFPAAEHFLRKRDIRAAHLGIVAGKRPDEDLALASRDVYYFVRKLEHCEFAGVSDVHRAYRLRLVHHADHRIDKVALVAEAARLRAVAVNCKILAAERLHDEITHHAPVVREHARAVRVENAHNADIYLILAMIIHKERFSDTLTLVVTAADADGVHVSPVALRLRMHARVTIDFARARLQNTRLDAFRKPEHIDCAHHACLDGLHRIELVMNRACGTRQIKNAVHFEENRFRHIVADELEARIIAQMIDVRAAPREKIIEANHFVPVPAKSFAKMRAQESRAARHKRSHTSSPSSSSCAGPLPCSATSRIPSIVR